MNKLVACLGLIVVAWLLSPIEAQAGERCRCKAVYKIRKCHLKEMYGACSGDRAKTQIKDQLTEEGSEGACSAKCNAYRDTVVGSLIGGASCRSNPGKQIALTIQASYGMKYIWKGKPKATSTGQLFRPGKCPKPDDDKVTSDDAGKKDEKKAGKTRTARKSKGKPAAKERGKPVVQYCQELCRRKLGVEQYAAKVCRGKGKRGAKCKSAQAAVAATVKALADSRGGSDGATCSRGNRAATAVWQKVRPKGPQTDSCFR